MRIQHNIMAMNAYRNYSNNTSSLSSNLEKLSSGYKINRAGDDAAGLAISEKMRAQITGLDQASSNVKDGISLVKTAEGALQEVQDMLNRMVELATQSANGTYDDGVDRQNLQAEVTALRTEIDRIADSANFNGIQLLDGSLDTAADMSTKVDFSVGDTLPGVGSILGTDSILYQPKSTTTTGTEFSVDLHDLEYTNKEGEKLTLKIGDNEVVFESVNGGTFGSVATDTNVDDIAAALAGATANLTVNGTAVGTAGTWTINGQEFTVTGSDNKLTFKQTAAPKSKAEEVSGDMSVTVSGAGAKATYTTGTIGFVAASKSLNATINYTDANGDAQSETVAVTTGADLAATVAAIKTAVEGNTTLKGLFDVTTGTSDVTFTSKALDGSSITGITIDAVDGMTISSGTTDAGTATAKTDPVTNPNDYNFQTTEVKNVTSDNQYTLASTYFDLTDEMVTDGSRLRIGNQFYEFTTDTTKTNGAKTEDNSGAVYVDASSGDLGTIAQKLTAAVAGGNNVYTVGADAKQAGRISLVEKESYANLTYPTPTGTDPYKYTGGDSQYDLGTVAGLQASVGFEGAAKAGKGLVLQIGDTSESYNQMSVNIDDMHAAAIGIGDISIEDATSAQAAVSVIKDAINKVSSTRGNLGAVQNRLEHTQNNLSVMSENIQDAESTIRDTDIAEEMMDYTKNNILVQSAQAMLAQANQVPQGVLQLLQ
jgi:flagellin